MEIAQCFGRHTGSNKWRVVSKNHTTCARLYQTKIFEGEQTILVYLFEVLFNESSPKYSTLN